MDGSADLVPADQWQLISGSQQNMQVEQQWLESMLRMQGPDGLIYWLTKGHPWFPVLDPMGWPMPKDQVACPFDIGRFLVVATAYHRLTGDDLWRKTGEKSLRGSAESHSRSKTSPITPSGISRSARKRRRT